MMMLLIKKIEGLSLFNKSLNSQCTPQSSGHSGSHPSSPRWGGRASSDLSIVVTPEMQDGASSWGRIRGKDGASRAVPREEAGGRGAANKSHREGECRPGASAQN